VKRCAAFVLHFNSKLLGGIDFLFCHHKKKPQMQSDKELFNAITKGNQNAFDALFRTYYAPLARFAFLFVKNECLADEIVQSFFVKLWQQRDKIRIATSVKSYLYTSVRNTALNFLKKEQTRTALQETYAKEPEPEKSLSVNMEFLTLVNEAVEQLPNRTKEVFLLCKNEGLTYSEIAQYLQISAKTVENNMGIAFRKLREYLMPYKNLIFD
jgi:RNA polymerase sigma-70 factor (ECF subfamily)